MTSAAQSLVSIVVLSYARPQLLKQSLDSLARQSYQPLEIIAVDNKSSRSDEIAKVVEQYPAVRLVANNQNLGFTGGMNKGMLEARGHYVYLTEDDVIVDEDCIATLVAHMETKPTTGLAAPIMYNHQDGTIRSAGGEIALEAIYSKTVFGAGEHDAGQFDRPFDVTCVPGAAIFSTRELLRRLKGFREDFFMYAEDNELCLRVSRLGFKVTVVPQAKVFHVEPVVAPLSSKLEFHKIKNLFSLYLLHAPLRVLPEFYVRYGVIGFLRALVSKPQSVWPRLKASLWFLFKAPGLVIERWRRAQISLRESTLGQRALNSSS